MKKLNFIATVILIVTLFTIPVAAGTAVYKLVLSTSSIYVQDKQYTDSDLPILNYDGNTYVPLSKVGKLLGAKIQWDGINNRIYLSQDNPVEEVAKQAVSCVKIVVYKGDKLIGNASGFGYNGYIITNKHVLDVGDTYLIIHDSAPDGMGKKTTDRITLDTDYDIGVLKSPFPIDSVKLGDSNNLKVGQEVIAIASPHGYKNTVSTGSITALRDVGEGDVIQFNAINHKGSSGGALFNTDGEVIGLIFGGYEDEADLGAALKINQLKPILEKLK